MHLKAITQATPEELTPLLILGALAALAVAAFILYLKTRHNKTGPRKGKNAPANTKRPRTKGRER